MRAARIRALLSQEPAQAGKNKRGFAAARTSDDSDESAVLDQAIERVNLTLAAEEIVAVAEEERPQAREGPLGRQRGFVDRGCSGRGAGDRRRRWPEDDVHG